MSKQTEQAEQTEAAEAAAPRTVDLTQLFELASRRATELALQEEEALKARVTELIESGQPIEAAELVGTARVVAMLTRMETEASSRIADAVMNDDTDAIVSGRNDRLAAKACIAELEATDERFAANSTSGPDPIRIATATLIASLELPDAIPGLKVNLAPDMIESILTTMVRTIAPTSRTGGTRNAIGTKSNRRNATDIADAVGGETFRLSFKHGRFECSGFISIAGAICIDRFGPKSDSHINVSQAVEMGDGPFGLLNGIPHATKDPVPVTLTANGPAYVGTIGHLSSLLSYLDGGNREASASGWKECIITSGPMVGRRLDDVVPHPS
jgi:hypothetical protein